MYAKRALILLAMLLCLACWSASPAHAEEGLPDDDAQVEMPRAHMPHAAPGGSWTVGALAIGFIIARRSLPN